MAQNSYPVLRGDYVFWGFQDFSSDFNPAAQSARLQTQSLVQEFQNQAFLAQRERYLRERALAPQVQYLPPAQSYVASLGSVQPRPRDAFYEGNAFQGIVFPLLILVLGCIGLSRRYSRSLQGRL